MLQKLERFFGRFSPAYNYTLALMLLAALGVFDHETQGEFSVIPLYWLPTAIAALGGSLAGGIAVAAASALVWMVANHDAAFSSPALFYWNTVGRFLFFSVMCLFFRSRRTARLQNEILSLVNHEFSNALGSMNLALGLLRDEEAEPLPETRRRNFDLLEKNLQHLRSSTQNFLNLHRFDSVLYGSPLDTAQLRAIIKDALSLLEPIIEEKNLQVTLLFPTDPVSVRADSEALALILSNLLSNAIKYTSAGGKVIVRIAKDTVEPRVVVSVEDSGIGVAEQDREKIFSGFYRTPEGKEAAKGFGLGLKFARGLVERHGSHLLMDSTMGKGSRFYFTLPLH